jgi:hypothetical protein
MDPTFQYAGATRIPPKQFQLRARIEHNTKDMVNLKTYKHNETNTPDLTHNFPQLVYAKGRTYDSITNRPVGYSHISDSENAKMSEFLYGTSTISYKDPSSDRLPSYARNRIEQSVDIVTGYKQPNYKIQNTPYFDMAPQNTRYDARDYKQAQPFVAGGPDLALNPYFDRYDPVSDPRNAVRELRSAVYEDKGGDKGFEESQKKLRRNFENRWIPEELITEDLMDSFLRNETVLPSIKGENNYSVKNIEKGLFNPDTFQSCDILDPIAKLVPKKPTVTMKDQIDQLLKEQKSRDEEDKKMTEELLKRAEQQENIDVKARIKEFPDINIKTDFLNSFFENKSIEEVKTRLKNNSSIEQKNSIEQNSTQQNSLEDKTTLDNLIKETDIEKSRFSTKDITTIPLIKNVNFIDSFLTIHPENTKIDSNIIGNNDDIENLKNHIEVFKNELQNSTGIQILDTNIRDTVILLELDKEDPSLQDNYLKNEYFKYSIIVQNKEAHITVRASNMIGLAHGTSTLLQQIRSNKQFDARIQFGTINDYSNISYSAINVSKLNSINDLINMCRFYKIPYIRSDVDLKSSQTYAESRGVQIIPKIVLDSDDLDEAKKKIDSSNNLTPYIYIDFDKIKNSGIITTLVYSINNYIRSKGKRLISKGDMNSKLYYANTNNTIIAEVDKIDSLECDIILNKTNTSFKNFFNEKIDKKLGVSIDADKVELLLILPNAQVYSHLIQYKTFVDILLYLDNRFISTYCGFRLIENGLNDFMQNNNDIIQTFSNNSELTVLNNIENINVYYSINNIKQFILYTKPVALFKGYNDVYLQTVDINEKPYGPTVHKQYMFLPFKVHINNNTVFIDSYKESSTIRFDFNQNVNEKSKILERDSQVTTNSTLYVALFDENNNIVASTYKISNPNTTTTPVYNISKYQSINIEKVYKESTVVQPIKSLLPFETKIINIEVIVVGGGGNLSSGGITKDTYMNISTDLTMNIEVGLPLKQSSVSFNDNIIPTIAYNGIGQNQGIVNRGDSIVSSNGYMYENTTYGAPGYQGVVIIRLFN